MKDGRCQVVIADASDDVFILKKAFEKGCPIVSRDNFREHQNDLRIDPRLRRWYADKGSKLQVKFTFDESGAFQPDYDHFIMPVLLPGSTIRKRTARRNRC